MDSFELNKILGAILGTILLVMGIGFLGEAIYAPIEGRGQVYNLPAPEGDGGHGAEPVVEIVTPLPVLLASASAEDGARVARKCQSCHNFGEGDGNKTGPALYGVIGAQVAFVDGFSYSDTLQQMASDGTSWTYEVLDGFLEAPRAYAPGTKMTFAGLRKPQDRADLLAYLQSLSGSPVAFPEVVEEAPMEEAHDEVAQGIETHGEVVGGEETAEHVVDAVAETTEQVVETVTEVTTEAVETVVEGTEAVTDAVGEAVEAVTDAVNGN